MEFLTEKSVLFTSKFIDNFSGKHGEQEENPSSLWVFFVENLAYGFTQKTVDSICRKTKAGETLVSPAFVLNLLFQEFLFYLIYDSFECFRMVHRQVSQDLAVDFDAVFV